MVPLSSSRYVQGAQKKNCVLEFCESMRRFKITTIYFIKFYINVNNMLFIFYFLTTYYNLSKNMAKLIVDRLIQFYLLIGGTFIYTYYIFWFSILVGVVILNRAKQELNKAVADSQTETA